MKTFDYVQERQVTIDKKAEIVYRRRGYSLCVSCRQAVLINKSHKSALKWQLTFMVTYPLLTTNYRLQTHMHAHISSVHPGAPSILDRGIAHARR